MLLPSFKVFLLCGLFSLVFLNCTYFNQRQFPSPAGYDFSKAEKIFLRGSLEEVSGIAFLPGSDSIMLAVNDEEGKIFEFPVHDAKRKTKPFRFAGMGDYEDLAFFAGHWRVLESNGVIHTANVTANTTLPVQKILPKGEYEGMAEQDGYLFVACKDCPGDDAYQATIYRLQLSGDSLFTDKTYKLDASAFIKNKSKKVLISALAKHPETGEWYILSHLNGCLIITDSAFTIKQFFALPPSLLLQPEGIAFASNGDLYISSEGDESSGYIVRFIRK